MEAESEVQSDRGAVRGGFRGGVKHGVRGGVRRLLFIHFLKLSFDVKPNKIQSSSKKETQSSVLCKTFLVLWFPSTEV